MTSPPPPQGEGIHSNMPPNMVVFGPNANCTLDLCPVEYSVYGYRPSLGANIAFIALYSLAIVLHAYLGVMWRQWWFTGCILAGAINAVLGYAGRLLMYHNPFNFVGFMIQVICVTTGPVYYCAAIYITFAMSIKHFSPELSRFDPKLFYYIIIPCDIVSLVLQAAGGGLSTKSSGQSKVGIDLAIAGMIFQVVTIVVFCGFFADFLIRYFHSGAWEQEKHQPRSYHGHATPKRLGLFFGFMGLAVLLILARCTFRLVELREGYGGKLVKDEALFIWLEGVMILASVYCLMVGHPGLVFQKSHQAHLQDLPNDTSNDESLRGKPSFATPARSSRHGRGEDF
ncbi:sphingoid long-chain base transporter RSB1 [Podospora conica]|nr:sphingoid long-chain base transporter RSB1 [Schizothecium conicum]